MGADDADLEELAKLCVSGRRIGIGILTVVLVGFGAAVLMASANVDTLAKLKPLLVAGMLLIGGGGFTLAMKVRTPPSAFPAIRVLRDRAGDVAWIISLWRGNPFVALTDSDGKLLAPPLRLKGAATLRKSGLATEARQTASAVDIAKARCPNARTAEAADTTGLTSLAKLARDAARGNPKKY